MMVGAQCAECIQARYTVAGSLLEQFAHYFVRRPSLGVDPLLAVVVVSS